MPRTVIAVTGNRTIPGRAVDERTTIRLTWTMVDELGSLISGNAVSACTFTLYNLATGAIINSRDDVDILNNNGGSWDVAGEFALELTPDDNQILDDTQSTEVHLALVEWTYAGGKKGKEEIEFTVRNMVKVPA